jgi:biopolymer transport protein ExbD
MRFRRNKDKTSISYIDMTALVDLVVVVLIFFMYSATAPIKANQVTLPETNSGDMPTREAITVVVAPPNLVINGHDAREDELKALPKDKDIIILAPKDIPYAKVMATLDALKMSGHDKVSLATKPVKG